MERKQWGVVLFLACVLVVTAGTGAWASPVQWTETSGGNGHWYEVITSATYVSWSGSRAEAEATTYAGVQGHLASITSDAENSFVGGLINAAGDQGWVYNGINGFMGPWIGGYQPENSYWTWTTGEAWCYTAWANNQPSNQADQDYVHYYVRLSATEDPTTKAPTWNDYADTGDKVFGYVVEYSTAAVPAPAAVLLLGSGLIGLIGFRRARGKRAAR